MNPVTLDSGRAGFNTTVLSEASRTWTKTIGIVWVSTRSADNPGGVLTNVRCRAHQLFCQRMRAINVARGPVIVRLDVASFRPTQALQRLAERRNARLCLRIALGKAHQHADPSHRLLRARRERPCDRRAAEKRG